MSKAISKPTQQPGVDGSRGRVKGVHTPPP